MQFIVFYLFSKGQYINLHRLDKVKIIYIIIVFLFTSSLSAQEDTLADRQVFGIFYNYNFNSHRVDFKSLPDVPNCCPQFNQGEGNGHSFGLLYELPLPFSSGIGLRISYSSIGGKLSSTETTLIKVDTTITQGIFDHTINTKINVLNFNPYLIFKPFAFLNITFGGYAGYIIQKDYEQKETIIEPKDRGVFVDTEKRTRNESSGEIKQTNSVNAGLNIGANLNFPLNKQKSLLISPEIFYFMGLSELVKDRFWKINNLSFGLALKYSPLPSKPKPPEDIFRKIQKTIIDTIMVIKEDINNSFFKTGKEIKSELKERTDKNLVTITEFINRTDTLFKKSKPIVNIELNTTLIYAGTRFVTQAFPLLPIIFFKNNSDEIEDYYNLSRNPDDFSEQDLEISSLNFHWNIIDIIGSRMKNNPSARINISGYADSTTEKSDCNLAKRRAEKIKSLLVNNWKIEENRINLTTREINCSPNEPTQSKNDSGFAENRRVEISSDNLNIMAPIVRKRYLERIDIEPENLQFNTIKSTRSGIKSWKLTAKQNNRIIISNSGNGSPPEIINQNINNLLKDGLISNYPLQIEFSLTDNDNQTETFFTSIPVRIDTSDIEIQRLSLILFGIASDKVPEHSRKNLSDFIKENYKSGEVKIFGYTDILGSPASNKILAESRAENVAKVIREVAPELKISEKVGIASDKFPPGVVSYSTPPERFLSRTVYIEFFKKWK